MKINQDIEFVFAFTLSCISLLEAKISDKLANGYYLIMVIQAKDNLSLKRNVKSITECRTQSTIQINR